ncbi:MAG TPA: hypothetical protein VHK90_12070 [Thermoanaerobaculia bacterium]|nr:hypothetical protein [Thermoanaerobaculia bacterium]
MLLAAACGSPYSDDPPIAAARFRYSGHETGPSTVGVIPDAVLNQDITLNVDYPTRGGPHPLIVFSPASGLSHRDYVGLSSYWAANNYVVLRLGGSGAEQMRAVLDSLDALEQRYPELQGKIDRTRIAVAGHAEGARAAMELASDPRIKAVVAMEPPAEPEVRLPALFIAAAPPPQQPAATATEGPPPVPLPEAFTRAPAGDKWAIVIRGARPQTFTGRLDDVTWVQARARAPQGDPFDQPPPVATTTDGRYISRADLAAMRQQDLFAVVRGAALAFLDTYMRNEAEAREALTKVTDRRGVTLERK